MFWQELQVIVNTDDVPRTETLLRLAGAKAISLASVNNQELLEPPPGKTPMWVLVLLKALFPPEIPLNSTSANLQIALGVETAITLHTLSDKEWKGAWESRTHTQCIGKRLLIAGAGDDITDHERVTVHLNLGLAFGTGEHPTTALCLEWLDAHLRSGTQIMDYGCGSGILAIAALQLGAAYGWAVDIDPQALTATQANACLNHVQDHLWIGTPDALPIIQADVVIANILANTLSNLVVLFERCIKPGGHLVLSGILEPQNDSLCQTYGQQFGPFTLQQRDEWTLISAPRR